MFILNLILLGLAAYFAKTEYDNNRITWACLWSILLGWDLHVVLSTL